MREKPAPVSAAPKNAEMTVSGESEHQQAHRFYQKGNHRHAPPSKARDLLCEDEAHTDKDQAKNRKPQGRTGPLPGRIIKDETRGYGAEPDRPAGQETTEREHPPENLPERHRRLTRRKRNHFGNALRIKSSDQRQEDGDSADEDEPTPMTAKMVELRPDRRTDGDAP